MDWGSYIKFAVPGMFMICLEWWSFEGGAFLMGRLSQMYVKLCRHVTKSSVLTGRTIKKLKISSKTKSQC